MPYAGTQEGADARFRPSAPSHQTAPHTSMPADNVSSKNPARDEVRQAADIEYRPIGRMSFC